GIVNAKSSPDRSGNDLFTIHEGTKVEIKEVIGDWCCIHVGNNIGWMPLAYLERI
ncbi:MAG: SH3 domain-containing protein, partial [Paludibacteraceae bacterium]|nr:SH3 domain-containing protein [Paludibacteraceae bacterium]